MAAELPVLDAQCGVAGSPLRVLVVDDERTSRFTAVRQLRRHGLAAEAVDNAYRALEQLAGHNWDVMLCDLRMPGMDGMELMGRALHDQPDLDVVVMTAYGDVATAVAAIQQGAADYLTKPFRYEELAHRIDKLTTLRGHRLEAAGLRALAQGEVATYGIVGRCPEMRRVVDRIRVFAHHDNTVLVTGETGTGKELVARALHELGERAKGPFVAVACGAIPHELAESQLFGHEKGAFSGAVRQRLGAFERADGGVLLLDDVDDLPLAMQSKLVRVLQERTFMRVGGSHELRVDVRVLSTTKVDLTQRVAEGRFRSDLFYRLRALEIHLPALRDRARDVLALSEHFLRQLDSTADHQVSLHADAATLLLAYHWPGNVRELRFAIESAAAVCTCGVIGPELLPEYLQRPGVEAADQLVSLHLDNRDAVPLMDTLRRVEDKLIDWAMQQAGGYQSKAAALLGLPRTTLRDRLQKRHTH